MRLSKLRIQNFRSFVDQTIEFSALTMLVGPNGAGKSNVLNALNVFFRMRTGTFNDKGILKDEDFFGKKTENPICITLTFVDLSPAAQEDFKAYYRNAELTVSAKASWSSDIVGAEVKHFGSRLGIKVFGEFYKNLEDGASATELKRIYGTLKETTPALPTPGSKAAPWFSVSHLLPPARLA